MITDEQFTTAMRAAVAERGADWTYPKNNPESRANGWWDERGSATYQDANGNATCIIGKALELAGLSKPNASLCATAVLAGATTDAVAYAARCAQLHQDRSRPWGEALAIYEWVLAKFSLRDVHYPSAWMMYTLACEALGYAVSQAQVETAKTMESIQKQVEDLNEKYAWLNKAAMNVTGSITWSSPVTTNTETVATISGLTYYPPVTQKEHALIA